MDVAYLRRVLLLLFLIGLWAIPTQETYATHAMGVDITYSCVGGNTFDFTLNFYRDCDGINAPATATLNFASASCGEAGAIPMNLSGPGIEVSPLCPAELGSSTCNGGTLPGVELYVYEGTHTFSANCTDWIISFDHCCRNGLITNLQNPNAQSMFVFVELNNVAVTCNNAPIFASLPVPFICVNQQFCYNHGAFDPDGDSLVYHLVNTLDGPSPGNDILYNAPYSPSYPMGDVSGAVTFDPLTGSFCITPDAAQVGVITVQVEEYRNQQLIGTTMRDLQIVVQNCTNEQPVLASGGMINQSGAVQLDSNSLELCPGPTISFDIQFSDGNLADNVILTSNVGTVIPGASWITSGTNPITASFSWTPTVADIGYYSFVVEVRDDGCPILGSQFFSYDIGVLDRTEAGPDLNYCPAGGPLQINVIGGTMFTWTTLSGDTGGLSCTGCGNPTASPNQTSVYVVESDLSPTCQNTDTLTVFRVNDFVLDAGPDETICKFGSTPLNPAATPPAEGPFSYLWSPGTALSNTTIQSPDASPLQTVKYYVEATSNAGCKLTDSVSVIVSGAGPQVFITPPDTVCENTPLQMTSTLYFECDTTSTPCSSPPVDGTIGTGASSASTYGPHHIDPVITFSNRKQYIFTIAELNAMGFNGSMGGRINSIAFDYASVGDQVNGIEIKMGCTTQDHYSLGNPNFITGLKTVKQPFNHQPVAGFNVFTFDHPYNWDGLSHLVIEFCVDGVTLGNPSNVRYTCLGANQTLINNLNTGAGGCSVVAGTPELCRPNIRFNYCQSTPASLIYAWTPSPVFSNDAIPDPIATPPISATYQLSVTNGMCTGTGFVDVNVAPEFVLDAGNDTTLCLNESAMLSATVPAINAPYNFTWSPGAGLDDPTSQTPVTSPLLTTKYYVTAESNGGCEQTDSLTVNISGVAPFVNAGEDQTVCPENSAMLSPLISFACNTTTTPCSQAANVGTIGTGGLSSINYSPYYLQPALPYSVRRQYIFTKAELDAMGFAGGGRINAIDLSFDPLTLGSTVNNMTIKMGCTDQDEFPVGAPNFIDGLAVVKNLFSHTPVASWNTFLFDNAYNWDGQSNLIVEFCTSQWQMGNPSAVHYTCGSLFNTLYLDRFFDDDGCGGLSGSRTQCRPNMRFTYCEALPPLVYNWTPTGSLDDPAIKDPTATPPQTTTYQVTVDDGGGCNGVDFVQVRIDSTAFVDAIADQSLFCPGDSILLNAAVTGTGVTSPLPSCGINGTACTQPTNSETIGTGNLSIPTYSPWFGIFTDTRAQYLFSAAELSAAGLTSGTVLIIGFTVSSKNSVGLFQNFTISMGCTSADNLSIGGWEPTVPVWGPADYVTNAGLNTFALFSPFDWDGSSNLVIETCYNNIDGLFVGNDLIEYTASVGFNSTLTAFSSAPGSDGCTLPPGNLFSNRPNVLFTVCPPPPDPFTYTWTPAVDLDDPNIQTPVAENAAGGTYKVTVSGGLCPIKDSVTVSCTPPLPVDGLVLSGHEQNDWIKLDWETLNQDAEHYQITRSSDGINFNPLGELNTTRKNGHPFKFEYTDHEPMFGVNFYRIIETQPNGQQNLSNIIAVTPQNTGGLVTVYPNPTTKGTSYFIEYQSLSEESLEVRLLDLLGRELATSSYVLKPGANLLEFSIAPFATGTYLLEIRDQKNREVRKVEIIN